MSSQVSSDNDKPIHKKPVKQQANAMSPKQPSNNLVNITGVSKPTLSKPTKQLGRTSRSASSTTNNQPTNSKPQNKKPQDKKPKDYNYFSQHKIKHNISNSYS